MTELSPTPLTNTERQRIADLLDARTKVAWKMTLIVALLDALFCVRIWAATTHSNRSSLLAIGVVVTAVLALVVANYGWSIVLRLRRDLRNGVKQAVTGTIRGLVRIPSAYGETVTRVTIGSEEVLTKGEMFAAAKEGQRMSVEYLPLSREALRASLLEETPTREPG